MSESLLDRLTLAAGKAVTASYAEWLTVDGELRPDHPRFMAIDGTVDMRDVVRAVLAAMAREAGE